MFFGKRRQKKKKDVDEPLPAEFDDDFGFEESSVQDPSQVRPSRRKPTKPDDSDDSLVSDSSFGRGLDDATFVEGPKAPPPSSQTPIAQPRSTPQPMPPADMDDTDEALPDATMFIGRAVDSTVLVVGWLVSTEGPTRGRDYRLNDGVTRVGKSPECQIRLPNDAYVSNTHATLTLEEGAYVLQDLGSTNGTLHNGARVTSRIRLEDGDQVRFGLSDFVFKSCRLG